MDPFLLNRENREGRSDDIFYFKKLMETSKPSIQILMSVRRWKYSDYQVTQLADGSITIALSHRSDFIEKRLFGPNLELWLNKQFTSCIHLSITNGTQHVN